MRLIQLTLILLVTLIFFINPALAHKIRIFAWVEGEMIHTESKFSGGKAAQKATIIVQDKTGKKELLRGKTGDDGRYDFPLPAGAPDTLKIIVSTGDGHKNSWLLERTPQTENSTNDTPQPATSISSTSGTNPKETSPLQEETLRKIIAEQLEYKLAPIRKTLAENAENSPSIQDILGGIGYITGLAGIIAYMRSKKQ